MATPRFFKPLTPVSGFAPETVFNEQNQPLSHDQFIAQGGSPGFENVEQGSPPGQSGPGGLPPLNEPAQNPMSVFSQGLFDLLTRAQGIDNAGLLNERNRLAVGQAERSQAPAADLGIEGLRPGDALRARGTESGLLNPEINNLTDRIQASAQAVSRFGAALTAARSFGEEFEKFIKPTDQDIQAVIAQMEAGFLPNQSILDKVGSKLPNDIWEKLAAAQVKNKKAGFKDTSGTPSGTQTDRDRVKRDDIVDETQNLGRGEDGFVSPIEYLAKAREFIAVGGSVANFLASVPPETVGVDPKSVDFIIRQLKPSAARSDNDNPFE